MNYKQSSENRLLQLINLDEFKMNSYENAKLYKEIMKRWHDNLIQERCFEPGQKVLLFNCRLRLFPGKLKSRWSGPFEIVEVFPHGAIEIQCDKDGRRFKVNGQRLKIYQGEPITRDKAIVPLVEPS
ncbi:uncharacterized protein LOC133310851 [Gastrolobium bilobum]|uniref:uncharacterized protein LOC133310851 n=1 Tax=Gastrolobium bilobum TaxID=150636 RepID=UPI002AAF4D83|nr:uncharacterized protein LOC133310851 [Gastrolobium bilobum]